MNTSSKLEFLKTQVKEKINTNNLANNNTKQNLDVQISDDDKSFTSDEMTNTWKDYLADMNKSSLSFLKERRLELKDNFKINLWLASYHEKELIEDIRINLIQFFRKNIQNSSIEFDFLIDENILPQIKTFTVEERFNAMASTNPLLNEMRQTLGLDFEY